MAKASLNNMHQPASTVDTPTRRWQWFWRLTFTLCGTAAVIWWWMMPGGFPVDHPRFLANRLLPVIVLAVAVVGRMAMSRGRWRIVRAVALGLSVAATAGCCAGAAMFPVSAQRFLPVGLLPAVLLWLAYWRTFRAGPALGWPLCLPLVAVAAVIAGICPWTQRGDDPATRPRDVPLPELATVNDEDRPTLIDLTDQVQVTTATGDIRTQMDGLSLSIAPLLTFHSRSPDRCWTILAPRRERTGQWRRLAGMHQADGTLQLGFADDELHWLRVEVDPASELLSIDARSQLEEPVFSHLNDFCQLEVNGHRELSIAFSPCPDTRVEVLPADYPRGRPRRLAYLDSDGVFRVVEASSGEKGPFHALASGPLAADAPLILTLFDAGRPVCELEFADWAAQASTELSPTAGWGLPVNAIEFERLGDAASAPVMVWITLAGTSVGRGWDSVGHRPGTYVNRLRVSAPGE
jgi:hypothetical protein